jgi:beta-glucosidase
VLSELFFTLLSKKPEILQKMTIAVIEREWKSKVLIGDNKLAIGQIGLILRPYPPRESAELANEIQKFIQENSSSKIPVLIHDEGLHGCMAKGSTIFPQSIGLSCTWNPNLIKEMAEVIGKETRTRGIHQVLSPTINIARDPRCGRTEETYGEDPYLTSKFAVAFVEGLQSQRVIATPKHYVANFAGDGGRDSYPIHFSERLMREIYLKPLKRSSKKEKLSL